MGNKRNPSLDYLRLVCMLMVVSMHYFGWGGVNNSPKTTKMNFIIASGIGVFCRVAVNCFFMISGYFIKDNEELEISYTSILNPIKKQYRKMWFYSVSVFIIFCLFNNDIFTWNGLFQSIMPIMSNQWWFMTVFIFLLCIKPFLGKLLTRLSDKELKLLLLCMSFFDMIQSIFGNGAFAEKGTGILHATFMLLVGYGIRRLTFFRFKKSKAIFLYFFSCVLAGVIALVEKKFFGSADAVSVYYNSPLIILASVAFFNIFLSTIFKSSWISIISSNILAIYLINDHPLVRTYVYTHVLSCDKYYDSSFMILHWAICVCLFTVVGISIDFLFTKLGKRLNILEG